MRARRAGRDNCVVGTLKPVLDRNVAGREIDQPSGNEERRDAPRPTFMQRDARFDDSADAADSGPHQHAGRVLIFVALRMPASARQSLIGGSHREDDEIVDLALLLRLHRQVGVEGAVGTVAARNHPCDLAGKIVDLEAGDAYSTVFTRLEPCPSGLDAAPERRHHTHAGDDDAPHVADLVLC